MRIKRIVSLFIAAAMVLAALLSVSALASSDETPIIDQSPKNSRWPQGSLATYQCVCSNDKGHDKFLYEWHIVYNGKDYKYGGNSDPWAAYIDKSNSGTVGNAIMFDGIQPGLDGAEIYCSVISAGATVSSPRAVIMVGDPIMFLPANMTAPTYVTCKQGEDVTLSVSGSSASGNVTEKRDFITYTWYKTESGRIQEMHLVYNGEDPATGKTYKPDTSAAGTYYYICGVFDGEENAPDMCNYSYTNIITLEVEEKIENIDIELASAPKKTDYFVGDTLDLTGLRVRILRSDGYMDLSDGAGVKVSPEKLDKAGEQTVTVTYEGLKTEFKVNVKEKSVAAPVITKQPQGGEYKIGQTCSLTVEATAESGCTLYYQWYELTDDQKTDNEIAGAVKQSFTPDQKEGDAYYRCYVYAVDGSGNTSAGIPSDTVKVTYKPADTAPDSQTGGETAEEVSGTEAPGTESGAVTDNGTAANTETPAETTDQGSHDSANTAVIVLAVVACVMFAALIAVIVVLIIILTKKKKQK